MEQLIVYKKFQRNTQAHLLKGILEEAGFFCRVTNENTPYPLTPFGSSQVWIRGEDKKAIDDLLIHKELYEYFFQ